MSFFGIGSGVAPSIWLRTSCRLARSLWSTSHFQIVCHRNRRTSACGQPRSWWPSMYTCLFQLDDSNSLHGKWLEITKHPLNKLLFGVPGGNSSIFQGSWKCWITILDIWFSWNGDLLLGLLFWSFEKNGHVPKKFGVKLKTFKKWLKRTNHLDFSRSWNKSCGQAMLRLPHIIHTFFEVTPRDRAAINRSCLFSDQYPLPSSIATSVSCWNTFYFVSMTSKWAMNKKPVTFHCTVFF